MKSKKIYLSALILGLMGGISSAHSAFGMDVVGGGASLDNEYLETVEEMEWDTDEIRLGWIPLTILSERWKLEERELEEKDAEEKDAMDKILLGQNPREQSYIRGELEEMDKFPMVANPLEKWSEEQIGVIPLVQRPWERQEMQMIREIREAIPQGRNPSEDRFYKYWQLKPFPWLGSQAWYTPLSGGFFVFVNPLLEKKIGTHSSATRVHTLDELKTLSYNPEHKDHKLRVGTNSVDLKNALISHGAVESERGKDVLITQEKLNEFLKSAHSEGSRELIRVTPVR